MDESSCEKRVDEDAIPDFNAGHGLEYTLYIGLILIMLVSLYLSVVTK